MEIISLSAVSGNVSSMDRKGGDRKINDQLKTVPDKEKNLTLLEINGYYPKKEYPERDFLNTEEMKEMTPYVEFQSHGMFHTVFPMCSKKELEFEMHSSKKCIERMFGYDCYAIAFPYGKHGDREIETAKRAGYSIARIANQPGLNLQRTNPYRLKSIGVDENMSTLDINNLIAWAEIRSYFCH